MLSLRSLRSAALGLALGGALLGAAPAMAGSTSGTFSVTANVVAACKVNSSTGIAFGNYDPANANATAALPGTGSMNITCTKSTVATVALDQGANANTGSTCTAPDRRMKAGTNFLSYGIYTDTGRQSAWGCTSGTNTSSFTSTTAASGVALTTYGSVPGGQDLPAGAYTDTVTFTVSF
jgi:spore coat protein U-like protein